MPDDAPQGICPQCLMRLGMESEPKTEAGDEPRTISVRPTPVPEEIATHFPQLEILELLGQGGMGIVYKARQPRLDRLVALKLLPLESASDPAFTERFNREAKALARLSHPGIVAVFDFGQAGPYFYFLMEFVDGLNLRQLVQSKQITPTEALAIVPKICDALQYAHDEGIVHRDIKPANILMDKKGRVKIADFGLAKLLGKATADPTLTATAQVMGTPHYMAPEQITGTREVDHRADIYSLGVVFYEMLTGQLPVGRFAPPSRKVQVDVRLDEIVLKALEQEPQRRYQQVSEVRTDVETISSATAGQFPVQTPTSSDGAAAVKGPAIGLIVTGVLNWIGNVIALLVFSLSESAQAAVQQAGLLVLVALFVMVGSAVVVAGGLKMRRLENYGFAVVASVLVMVLTPGNIIGLPVGIWSLVTLLRPEMRAAFRRRVPISIGSKDKAQDAEIGSEGGGSEKQPGTGS